MKKEIAYVVLMVGIGGLIAFFSFKWGINAATENYIEQLKNCCECPEVVEKFRGILNWSVE